MSWWDGFVQIASPLFGLAGVTLAAWLALRGRRVEVAAQSENAEESAVASRIDAASELAKYVREQVAAEVERQVAPIREELEKVKLESHAMNDAVRARETQLWLWDHRGRPGSLPMLPAPILHRLGLGHMLPLDELDDTLKITKENPDGTGPHPHA